MSVLCSACQMRRAHRVWESGRGKCDQCYALDPREPPAPARHAIRAGPDGLGRAPAAPHSPQVERSGEALREIRERVQAGVEAGMKPTCAEPECGKRLRSDSRNGRCGQHQPATKTTRRSAGCEKPLHPLVKGNHCRACREGSAAAGVQARAHAEGEKVQRLKGEKVERALARGPLVAVKGWVDGGRVKLAAAAHGEILVPLTARTSALLWSGVASLPLAEQAELLRKLEL